MARPKGIIRIKGTISGLSFYKRLGKETVRTPGGPSSEQLRTRKSCQRNRENIDEFYHEAVQAAKSFRVSLKGMKHLWHPDLSGMLNKIFRTMMEHSPGIRGQRPVSVLTHKEMLKQFSFHPDISFESIVKFPYSYHVNSTRNSVLVSIPGFNSPRLINAPSGATHFRLLSGISVLSEYVFIKSGEKYMAADAIAEGQSHITYSDFISVHANIQSFTLETALSPAIVPVASSGVILSLGIEFYQEVNGIMNLLKQNGCMKVMDVI